jgi:2-keto-4-pentenoate hydratase
LWTLVKLAFNSVASRSYYGLGEGCIAPLFARDIRQEGTTLQLADFHSLVIEPEICLQLGRDLDHIPGLTTAQAMAAVAAIRPAVEVMDPRGAFALDPSAAQAVAQGIHTAGAVLGAPVPAIRSQVPNSCSAAFPISVKASPMVAGRRSILPLP